MPNRVFITGAGFSASAGLPLIDDLSRCCLQALQERDQRHFKTLLEAMQKFFPDTSWTRQWLPNIEDFLDRIIAYEDLFGAYGGIYRQDYFKEIRTLASLGLCLALVPTLGQWNAKAIDNFVKKIQPGDTILTFNWDTLLEFSLYKHFHAEQILYCPLTYERKSSQRITFVKLHGSIDWLDDKEYYPERRTEDRWEKIGHHIWRLKEQKHFAPMCMGVPAFIIPPTSRKTYDQHPDIKEFWDVGFWSIRESPEIYIIGYGFPKTDIHAQALIQVGILNNTHGRGARVRIIDKDEKAGIKFCEKVVPSGACDFLHALLPFERHELAQ